MRLRFADGLALDLYCVTDVEFGTALMRATGALLDRFDFVIASIHSRFRMDGDAMRQRVLRAIDDPHMTILAHSTGRLLLSRESYAIDLDAHSRGAPEWTELGVAMARKGWLSASEVLTTGEPRDVLAFARRRRS